MFSIKFWNFSAIIFSKNFLPLSLSSSSGTPVMHMLVCLMMSRISLRLFGLPDLSWSIFCWFFLLWVQIYCRAPLSEVFVLFIVHFHFSSQPLIGWRLFLTPLSHWCLHPLLLDLCCVAWRLFSQFREFMSLSCVQPKTEAQMFPLLLLLGHLHSLPEHQDKLWFLQFSLIFLLNVWLVSFITNP